MTAASRRRILDAALLFALLAGAEVVTVTDGGPSPVPAWLRGLLVAVVVGPLPWRRRTPVVVWAVSAAATAVAIGFSSAAGPVILAPMIALYTVASRGSRRASVAAGAISLAGLAALSVSGPRFLVVLDGSRIRSDGTVALAALTAVCWLIGDNLRVRRAYVAELRAKAQRAEADQQAELAGAAAQERTRIARELHDVVVHHVSCIAVQAGAARMLAGGGTGPAGDGPAWSGIEATARQALSELRQLLGVLRSGQDPPARNPQPGMHDLAQLIEESRQAGLPVEASAEGCRVSLPASVSLAGYRIIQEALTNVRKHQGCAATSVAVHYRPRELAIEVSSQLAAGPPPRPGRPGYGLVGMRERVTLLGGEIHAGPRPDGGFLVTARIPLERTVA